MKIYLFTVEALDELDNPVTLRFASGEYNYDGEDWEVRLKQPALFTTSAFSGGVLSDSRSGFGEAVIVNPDGGLNYLADYAVDGRLAELYLFDNDTNVSVLLLSGTVSIASFDRESISFKLRDPQEELELEHPQDVYLGNNVLPSGLEGVEGDIKGKKKPKVFGDVENASPYLVNTSKLIYEVSTNVCSVSAVYDRGVLLTKGTDYVDLTALEATAPSAGQFRSIGGYFRLGASPTGTVTCNAESTNTLLGDVFKEITLEGGYVADATDVTNMNAYGVVGIYLNEDKSTANLLDVLAGSAGAYWTFDLSQNVLIKILDVSLTEDLEVNEYEILGISRRSVGAGKNGLPYYKVTIQADKIETPQNDLAGAVSEVFKARIANQYRDVISESASVKTRHPLSGEITVQSTLRSLVDAKVVSDRLLSLLSVRRDLVELTLRLDDVNTIKIGTDIKVITPRYGYDSGRIMKVLGLTINAKKNEVTLDLFG